MNAATMDSPISVVVGVDVVDIEQIGASIRNFGDRFLRRVYTQAEIDHCAGYVGQAGLERLATRFAAKEASVKALRPQGRWLDPRSIEVTVASSGAPSLVFHGEAQALADRAGLASWSLSMSHEARTATAVVVALCHGVPQP